VLGGVGEELGEAGRRGRIKAEASKISSFTIKLSKKAV